jgi:putative addiction module component (TIGR02574 family)
MTLADLPVLQKLSKAEKLQLVEDLWDEIAASPDDLPISAEEIALLNKRRAAHRAAPDEALSLEEFKRQLAERL